MSANICQINFGTEKRNNTGSWRIPLGISFLWVLILGCGIVFFPESPRYDFRHGRTEEARETMRKLYGVAADHPVLAEELAEIKAKHEEELLHRNQKWYEMFTAPRMAYRIALGMTLQMLQQLVCSCSCSWYPKILLTGARLAQTTSSITALSSFRVPESTTHTSRR